MELSIADRLILLSILPQESDIITLKIIRKLKDDLSFSEDELAQIKFKIENDTVSWEGNVPNKEVSIGEKATDIIVEAFKKLNSQKKLKEEHIYLYDKFVGN